MGLYRKINESKNYIKNPLYKNSFYIMLASISSAFFGFIFWILAAKIYTPQEVGLGTAIISVISLICLFSYLGFDQSIIRFFPQNDKGKIFSTSIIIVSSATVLLGILFLIGLNVFSPKLLILRQYSLIFIVFLLTNSIVSILGVSFIALRKTEYYLIQNVITGLRVPLLFLFVIFGALGIFYSVGLSLIFALMTSFIILLKMGVKFSGIDKKFLKKSMNFATENYLVGLLGLAPNYIMPIIVLNTVGSSNTAYYYIAFTIFSILGVISSSFSTSLFVEGSHGVAMKRNTIKSLLAIFMLLSLGILFIFIFGKLLLSFIGHEYVKGFNLLMTLSFSSLFIAIYQIYFSIKKVQKRIKGLIIINTTLFAFLIGSSYIFLIKFGIIGIGYSWIISYGLITLLIILLAKKEFT